MSSKQKRTLSDVKSSSRSLSFSSDGLEMFLQYNCCGKQYLLSGLVYAAVVFKNEKKQQQQSSTWLCVQLLFILCTFMCQSISKQR